jgi:hypothetical protein
VRPDVKQMLLVEPDLTFGPRWNSNVRKLAFVESVADFQTARPAVALQAVHDALRSFGRESAGQYLQRTAPRVPARGHGLADSRRRLHQPHTTPGRLATFNTPGRFTSPGPGGSTRGQRFCASSFLTLTGEGAIEDRRFLFRGGRRASDVPLAEPGPA